MPVMVLLWYNRSQCHKKVAYIIEYLAHIYIVSSFLSVFLKSFADVFLFAVMLIIGPTCLPQYFRSFTGSVFPKNCIHLILNTVSMRNAKWMLLSNHQKVSYAKTLKMVQPWNYLQKWLNYQSCIHKSWFLTVCNIVTFVLHFNCFVLYLIVEQWSQYGCYHFSETGDILKCLAEE